MSLEAYALKFKFKLEKFSRNDRTYENLAVYQILMLSDFKHTDRTIVFKCINDRRLKWKDQILIW